MIPEWIVYLLKDNGAAGAVIFVLLSVVGVLWLTVQSLYKHNQKVYGFRLAERDILNKTLTETTAAINSMKNVSDERNQVTDELAVMIKLLAQKMESNHAMLKDEVARNGSAIVAAANIYAKTVDDLRDFVLQFNGRHR